MNFSISCCYAAWQTSSSSGPQATVLTRKLDQHPTYTDFPTYSSPRGLPYINAALWLALAVFPHFPTEQAHSVQARKLLPS